MLWSLVTGAQVVEEINEAWPLEGLAGDHVLEHLVRSGGLEAAFVPREVLVAGGVASIAEDGGHGFNGDHVWPSEPLKEGVSAAAKSALRVPRCRLAYALEQILR